MRTTTYRAIVALLDVAVAEPPKRGRIYHALAALDLSADQIAAVTARIEADEATSADERWTPRLRDWRAWSHSLELARALQLDEMLVADDGADEPLCAQPRLRLVHPAPMPAPRTLTEAPR